MCSPDGSVRVLLAAQPLTRSARLALSPSGRELALLCAHNEVLLFSLAEAKISRRWTLPSDSAQVGPDIVGGLIFVEANTLVVLGDNGSTVRRFKW